MSRDQLADWLHCLEGGMYDWVQEEIQKELNKPNQFYPDWDTLQPFYERIAELEKELAKPEQEPIGWFLKDHLETYMESYKDIEGAIPLYTAPPRKPWQGLTSEDWENTPDTGKVGCERDAELFDWIEQTLKNKNDTL
jgi:hypothetical protein